MTANQNTVIYDELDLIENHLQKELGYDIKCEVVLAENPNYGDVERKITLIAVDYENKEFIERITAPRENISDNIFSGL